MQQKNRISIHKPFEKSSDFFRPPICFSALKLAVFIEKTEQKTIDTAEFIRIVKKYERITELTPELMHELIEKIIVYAPDKSS